jgi:aryl-alcohol dehydrogenase-like predicted oxidoreductase
MTVTDKFLEQRSLGSEGLSSSAIGLGTMGMTMAYGDADTEGGIAAIRRAHDLGITMIDTAELYGAGTGSNEELVGRAIEGFRDDVIVATKFGYDFTDPAKFGMALDSRPERILQVVENSLRYLGTGHIDVLYQHRVDPEVPIEDVAGTVGDLISAGKVRFLGLSEAGPETIRRAHATHPVSVVQTEYSIFERGVETAVLPTLRELGIGFVAYSPLGRGFLTEVVRRASEYPVHDMRRTDDRWQPGNFEKNCAAVSELKSMAAQKDATVSQLAIAWLLAQGDDIVPIPGTRRPGRVEENARSTQITLSDDDLQRIGDILPTGAFGARYNSAMLPQW